MKRKDFTDLKGKTVKELSKLVDEKKLEAKKAKMNSLGGKDKNLKSFRSLRRDVAQILTLIREKEIVEKLEVKNEKIKAENDKRKEKS